MTDDRVEALVRRLWLASTEYHDDACCGRKLEEDIRAAVRAGLELAAEVAEDVERLAMNNPAGMRRQTASYIARSIRALAGKETP